MIRKFSTFAFSLLSCSVSFSSSVSQKAAPRAASFWSIPFRDPIGEFAQKNYLNQGVLQKVRDYVYVRVPDEYLTQLFDQIKQIYPYVQKPCFHGEIGPHFSVIRHDEWKGIPPDTMSEIGRKYLFTPLRMNLIQTAEKKLWVLLIEPEKKITLLRRKYLLSDKPYGQSFHITLAQQPNEIKRFQ